MPKELIIQQRMTPEFRLVMACSWKPQNSVRQQAAISGLIDDLLDWNDVVQLITRHGLVGIFCLVMGERGWAGVPEVLRNRLKGLRLQQTAVALIQSMEQSKVTTLCSENDIELIPLKGVSLSQELYNDPAVRMSGDIDVMVQAKDVATVHALLEKIGYRHSLDFQSLGMHQQRHIIKTLHHHEYVNSRTGIHLELHWRSFLWTEDQVKQLWAASHYSGMGTDRVRHLSKFDSILFLADHGARHMWQSLKWLSDLAMLMEVLGEDEWLDLWARAACFDLERVMHQTTLLLERCYGIEPPARISSLIAADKVAAELADQALKHLLSTREELADWVKSFAGPRLAFMTKKLKPATTWGALMSNLLIKPEDFLEVPLPDGMYWFYPLLRPFLWFRRHYIKACR